MAPTTTETPATTEPAPTTTKLAGEPIEHPYFVEGSLLGVIGVAFDDVLNVRSGPGVDQAIITTLDPHANEAVATGRARMLPASGWIEVTVGGVTGWANSGFFAFIGPTEDITSQVGADLGEVPRAQTMLELGALVAETRASDEEGLSTIIVTAAPAVGDVGEVTYDVLGLADDAQVGERVHVFGRPLESGEGFELMSVEGTQLCGRGGSLESFCV